MSNWLLPEYIADVLPSEARKIEELRRKLLDLFRSYGYELVMPPMLEYLESLLTQADEALALRTFKLVDQLSGKTMGLRADITPQVARIDAHLLNRQGIARLCYVGSVVHTKPRAISHSRECIQMGAEIFGYPHLQADLEIQQLIMDVLRITGLTNMRLDLNHAAIFNSLISLDVHAQKNAHLLQQALTRKDQSDIAELTKDCQTHIRQAFEILPHLYGKIDILNEAANQLPMTMAIEQALLELKEMAQSNSTFPMTFDLADLRGYTYHNGIMLTAYAPGVSNAIIYGGRYDGLGKAFGRARFATGFSFDLRELAHISNIPFKNQAILAPWGQDADLLQKIQHLRENGEIVIQSLPNAEHIHDEFHCDRILFFYKNQWIVKKVEEELDLALKKLPIS